MSIFSRVRKAKKAAEDHKKTPIQSEEPKPAHTPYKHVPQHAARDALSAMPPTWSPQEIRARMDAARKRKSEMIASASAPATFMHSRAHSATSLPTRGVYRSESDLSIDSVMQNHLRDMPKPLRLRGSQPLPPIDTFVPKPFDIPANFSSPRHAPAPPTKRHSRPSISAKNQVTERRKSPLSTVFNETDTEDDSMLNSSQNSTYSRASSQTSSQTSSVGSGSGRSGKSQASKKLSRLSFAGLRQPKPQPAIEISLPFASEEETNVVRHSIPTWRYEDFEKSGPGVEGVELKIPSAPFHARRGSFARSIFYKKQVSVNTV